MLSVEGLSSLSLFMWPCVCLWVRTSLRSRIKINKWIFLRMTASFLSTRETAQWEWTFLPVICLRNLRTPAEMSTVDQSQQCILVYTLYSYTLSVLDTHLTNLVHVALALHEWGMSFEIIWPMAGSGSERERLTDRLTDGEHHSLKRPDPQICATWKIFILRIFVVKVQTVVFKYYNIFYFDFEVKWKYILSLGQLNSRLSFLYLLSTFLSSGLPRVLKFCKEL